MLKPVGWFLVGTLIAAAGYELALALGAGSPGREPGSDVAGSGVVQVIAFLAILAAAVLSPFLDWRPLPAALLAPAAAAFLVAFFFTYDPYFAPDLRRYSDGGAVAGRWIALVVIVALADGVLTRLQPRLGRVTTSLVLLVVLVTIVFAGDGH
jgi:uncharacterized membrane protein YbaN (DUF454 family)